MLNGNILDGSIEQYDSMVKEKTVASRSKVDLRWSQIIPSSECSSRKRQWPIRPTFRHGTLDYRTIVKP